jgi:hypothetical protein
MIIDVAVSVLNAEWWHLEKGDKGKSCGLLKDHLFFCAPLLQFITLQATLLLFKNFNGHKVPLVDCI